MLTPGAVRWPQARRARGIIITSTEGAGFALRCLQACFDPGALEALRAPAPGLDWDAWVDSARTEGVTPLLYRILQGRAIVPAAVEGRLRAAYYRSAHDNALRFRDLGRALHQLVTAGVPVILLKGAALAEAIYGNVATRPMTDIDLLVRPEDLAPALAALAKLGYQVVDAEIRASSATVFDNQVELCKPGLLDTHIEIHWSLIDSPHYQQLLPMEWFWGTALPVSVEGANALVLGPEALLLHLCAHLALHHGGEGLLWLHDVAQVLYFFKDRLDWDLLLAKAAECDLVLPLKQILPRVVEGWAAPVPAESLRRLRRLEPSPEEVRVFDRLTVSEWSVAQRSWADLESMPGWRRRTRYLVAKLFPAPAYMRQRYGIPSTMVLPFCYPYRWLLGVRSAVSFVSRPRNQGG